ncbi:hypothetical protein ACO2Q8_03525 [Larkinella sp. VNQ87]|uniref:hypothetical protein n=1 Tax=Larkinella sp. VNQ87 TaxID=3400921 RepID=UPI003C114465
MKTYLFALALIGVTVLSVQAQDNSRLRNDVTYSTANYKHPNKAATARKWTNQSATTVSTPVEKGQVASYKQPVPGIEPVGGLVVPHVTKEDLAERNYKTPRINSVNVSGPAAAEVAENGKGKSMLKQNK